MHSQVFSLIAFLVLPLTASKFSYIDPSMYGLADVCLCINITHPRFPKEKAGLKGLRQFLKSTDLRNIINITNSSDDGSENYKGSRLALVKIDHSGFTVLMHFNDPSPISKLSSIADEHFKDEQNLTTPTEKEPVEIFHDIRAIVFSTEHGDRIAPNVIIYFYLPEAEPPDVFHKTLLDYGIDISICFATFKEEFAGKQVYLRQCYTKSNVTFGLSQGDTLGGIVVRQLHSCLNRSMYTYTKCFYIPNQDGSPTDHCIRHKVFFGAGMFQQFCWHGESHVPEPCDTPDGCDQHCEKYIQSTGPCRAPCNSTGRRAKTYWKNATDRYSIHCNKEEDCVGPCGTDAAGGHADGASPGFTSSNSAGEITGRNQKQLQPDATTDLPEWAKASIIAAVVISGLVFLTVVGLGIRAMRRRNMAKKKRARHSLYLTSKSGRGSPSSGHGDTGGRKGRKGRQRTSSSRKSSISCLSSISSITSISRKNTAYR